MGSVLTQLKRRGCAVSVLYGKVLVLLACLVFWRCKKFQLLRHRVAYELRPCVRTDGAAGVVTRQKCPVAD